jgi:hypothetical protein
VTIVDWYVTANIVMVNDRYELLSHFSLINASMIQMDIGGHPPIPLAQRTVFHFGSFLQFFESQTFWGRFEALNDVFLDFWGAKGFQITYLTPMEVVLLG